MRALSLRQSPSTGSGQVYAEEILRVIKKIEYGSHTNGVRLGERFYICAAMQHPSSADMKGVVKLNWTDPPRDLL